MSGEPIELEPEQAFLIFNALELALTFSNEMLEQTGMVGPVDQLGPAYDLLFDLLFGDLPPGLDA